VKRHELGHGLIRGPPGGRGGGRADLRESRAEAMPWSACLHTEEDTAWYRERSGRGVGLRARGPRRRLRAVPRTDLDALYVAPSASAAGSAASSAGAGGSPTGSAGGSSRTTARRRFYESLAGAPYETRAGNEEKTLTSATSGGLPRKRA
jgi:hypothetical protein